MEKSAKHLLTWLIGIVAVAQFIQVFTRYILQTPVMGLEEATVFPSMWLYMLGAANASRENTQIRANVLEIFIKSDRGHAVLGIVTEIVSLIICGWLTYWVWDFIRYSWRSWRESATLYWPTFYSDIALLVCLILVFVFTVKTLVGHINFCKKALLRGEND